MFDGKCGLGCKGCRNLSLLDMLAGLWQPGRADIKLQTTSVSLLGIEIHRKVKNK